MKCELVGIVSKSTAKYLGEISGYHCETSIALPDREITIPTDFEFFKTAGYKQKVRITIETIE